MSSLIHTTHEYILLLVQYLAIFAVLGFMPIPLFSFFAGDSITSIDHNPLFEYFEYYPISTDSIIDNVFTNVYVSQSKANIDQWEVDNAVLWADSIAYKLSEQGIPVIRKVYQTHSDTPSLKALYDQSSVDTSFLPENLQKLLLNLKAQFELLIPIGPVTEDARQWVILALSSHQKNIKKILRPLISQFPNDNFLFITQNPVNLSKKTLQISLPNFNIKQAKRSLSQGLKITQKQAEILLIENKKSLWLINGKKGQSQQISFKSLLKQNYQPLSDLLEREEEVLGELCKEGKLKVIGKKLDLSEFGVRIKNKNYEWENEEARINYELHKETLCGKEWIDVETFEDLSVSDDKEEQAEVKSSQKEEEEREIDQDDNEQKQEEKKNDKQVGSKSTKNNKEAKKKVQKSKEENTKEPEKVESAKKILD